ncbi:uncharacterized protein TNCV_2969771 [Trichonephila clavipes]|nr:uncharacterized protein TNCV_2969771 [Trichonephila clavipes]
MVMSETHSEKRKFGKAGESSVNKKSRREVSKKYGKFTEDCIPDGVFPIGDDVFVFASTYYDSASVHIRRFKKYGKTYYPTPEGITLDPRWIEYIMRKKKKVPESLEELPSGLFPPERHIQITKNKISHFKTQLPSPVCLNGEWEVGLSEIIYPHSWLNVNETNNYFLYKAGDGNISSTVKRTIDVGCYETMLDIISAVQLALPKNPNRFTIIYNKATKRVKINAVQGSSLHLENVGELLGFKRNSIIIGQIGSGLTHYKGINFQKGYGIGGIFRRLFRTALPFLVKGGKTIGKEVLMTGSRVASDVLSGENFKEAVKTRSRESGKKLAQKAIDRVQSMVGKGQYKRKHSPECVKSELELFNLPGTQTVIQDGQWKQFHPLSNVFDNAPVEFHISGSAEDYIDLSQTQLYVKAKIVKVDNTPITKDDTIGPVNLFLHSLFSQVDVSLNDRVDPIPVIHIPIDLILKLS